MWASAVREGWLPRAALRAMMAAARLRLTRARNPWAVVRGPATALMATLGRLGWLVHDAFSATTDAGELIEFGLDSPAAVSIAVRRSVRRWRWRNVEYFGNPSTYKCQALSLAGDILGGRREGEFAPEGGTGGEVNI